MRIGRGAVSNIVRVYARGKIIDRWWIQGTKLLEELLSTFL
jgi:hypothetical protein